MEGNTHILFTKLQVTLKGEREYQNGLLDNALKDCKVMKIPLPYRPMTGVAKSGWRYWGLFQCIKDGIAILDTEFQPSLAIEQEKIILYGAQDAGKSSFAFIYLAHKLLKSKKVKGFIFRMLAPMGLTNDIWSQIGMRFPRVLNFGKELQRSLECLRSSVLSWEEDGGIPFIIMDQVDLSGVVGKAIIQFLNHELFDGIQMIIVGSGGPPPNPGLLSDDEQQKWKLLGMRMVLTGEEFAEHNRLRDCRYEDYLEAGYRYGIGEVLNTVKSLAWNLVEKAPGELEVARRYALCDALAQYAPLTLSYFNSLVTKQHHPTDITKWVNIDILDDSDSYTLHITAMKCLLGESYIEPENLRNWQPVNGEYFQVIRPSNKPGSPHFRYMLPANPLRGKKLIERINPMVVAHLGYGYHNGSGSVQATQKGISYESLFYLDLMYCSLNGPDIGVKVVFEDQFDKTLEECGEADGPRASNLIYHACKNVTSAEYHASPTFENDGKKEKLWRPKSCSLCLLTTKSHVVCYSLRNNLVKANFPGYDYIHIEEAHEFCEGNFAKTITEAQLFQITISVNHPVVTMKAQLDSFLKARENEGLSPEKTIVVWYSPISQPLKTCYFQSELNRVWRSNVVIKPCDMKISQCHDFCQVMKGGGVMKVK